MGEHGGIYETSKFNINMRKFLFIFCCIILFSSCIKKNEKDYLTKKEILEDCKILENYLKTSLTWGEWGKSVLVLIVASVTLIISGGFRFFCMNDSYFWVCIILRGIFYFIMFTVV